VVAVIMGGSTGLPERADDAASLGEKPRRRDAVVRSLAACLAGLLLAGMGEAQVTERVNVASTGAQANHFSDLPGGAGGVVSGDGRFVAFRSAASNLVPGDTNATWDIFVRDRLGVAS
jgi:hypothetical protein